MTSEELNDLRDKVGTVYSSMLRGMLKVNEIPEAVVVRYFVIKKVIDKIDGRLSAGDLLRIAMDVGFNPETGLFEKLWTAEELLEKSIIPSNDSIAEATTGPSETEETVVDLTVQLSATDGEGEDITTDLQELAKSEDAGPLKEGTVIEPEEPDAVAPDEPEAVTDEVEDDDEFEDEPETIPEPIEIAEPEEDEIIQPEQTHEIGATVSAYVDGDVRDGVLTKYEDGEYTLEVNGQNFTVTEDDID